MTLGFALRLIGTGVPDGGVPLATLAPLAGRLQELVLRLGNDLLATDESGHADEALRALTALRLVSLAAGSTCLRFARGCSDGRDDDLAASVELDAKFWEILTGIAGNQRPAWVSSSLAQAAGGLVVALAAAAPEIELRKADAKLVRMNTAALDAEVWQPEPAAAGDDEVVISGRLEAVDLRNGRLRVVDDVSNRLILEEVKELESAARLIGQRVRAVGIGIFDSTGRLKGAKHPTVEAQRIPASWLSFEPADLTAEFAKPGPTLGGGADLTDEEFADFMATIKGQ